jgi:hypothetical protein
MRFVLFLFVLPLSANTLTSVSAETDVLFTNSPPCNYSASDAKSSTAGCSSSLGGIPYAQAIVSATEDIGNLRVVGNGSSYRTGEDGFSGTASYDDTVYFQNAHAGFITGEYQVLVSTANDQGSLDQNWAVTITEGTQSKRVNSSDLHTGMPVALTDFWDGNGWMNVTASVSGWQPETYGDFSVDVSLKLLDFKEEDGTEVAYIHGPEPNYAVPIVIVFVVAACVNILRKRRT